MKKFLLVLALLALLPASVLAGIDDLLGSLLGDMVDPNAARRKRYARRYEIMMVRDAKQGRVTPLVSVESAVMPVANAGLTGQVAPSGAINDGNLAEKVSVRVESLVYDENSGKGVLKVEVVSGTFSAVNNYLRANIGKLIRNDAPGEDAPKVPPDDSIRIDAITIGDSNICEVLFSTSCGTSV